MVYFFLLTARNCGTLSNPANGQVSHTGGTTYGKRATYSCNTGYYRVGTSIRTCLSTGRWSGSAPTCPRMLLLLTCMHVHVRGQAFRDTHAQEAKYVTVFKPCINGCLCNDSVISCDCSKRLRNYWAENMACGLACRL